MDEWRRESLREHTVGRTVLSLVSLLALMLAVIGLYALVVYLASERATELAIRTSLGATPRSLTHLVLSSITRVVTFGIVIGVAGTFGLAQVLRTWLFGITPGDPQLMIATAVLMTAVAVAATLGPAIRAGRTNPAELFR
jgi:ABC-type antimicrobial peptide transport system permease subunit